MGIRSIIRKINSQYYNFEGNFKYNFQFKISFPVSSGYRETGIINVVVPANNPVEAKKKLTEFVKNKIKVTVLNIKKL